MIPYFELNEIPLFGNVTLKPFGMLVVGGILAGAWFAQKRARQAGIPEEDMSASIKAAVIPGLIFSHVLDLFISHSDRIEKEGWVVVLKIWDGLSSMEGFLGAYIGMTIYFKITKKPWLRIADVIVQALVLGWIFGRLGCTVSHDHQGELTDFFLAFGYSQGARHNLGFDELLYTALVIFPVMLSIHAKAKIKGSDLARPGTYVAVASLLYAPIRFFLDFLRSTDKAHSDLRWNGMTDSQFACIALMIFGVWMWFNRPALSAATVEKSPRRSS